MKYKKYLNNTKLLYICIILIWHKKLSNLELQLLLGFSEKELEQNLHILLEDELIESGQKIIWKNLDSLFFINTFKKMPAPHLPYLLSLYLFYTEGIKSIKNYILQLFTINSNSPSQANLKYFYDIIIDILYKEKTKLKNQEEIRNYIQNVLTIHINLLFYPFEIEKGIKLIIKAKSYAFYLGDKRSIAQLELIAYNLAHNTKENKRTNYILKHFSRSIDYILKADDDELEEITKPHLCVYYFTSGELMESFRLGVSILHQHKTDQESRLVSQIHLYVAAVAFYQGEYKLLEKISENTSIAFANSLIFLLALQKLLQAKYEDFFKIIKDINKYKGTQGQSHRKFHKSILICHYFSVQNKTKQSYLLYSRNVKPFIQEGFFITDGHILSGLFLEHLLSVYNYEPSQENRSELYTRIKHHFSNKSLIHLSSTYRILGMLNTKKKNNHYSIFFYKKALSLAYNVSNQYEIFINSVLLAQEHLKRKQQQQSYPYVLEAYRISQRNSYTSFPKELLPLLTKQDFTQQDTQLAKSSLLSQIRNSLRKISDFTPKNEYIRQIISTFVGHLGLLNTNYYFKEDNKINLYLQIKTFDIINQNTDVLDSIHDIFEKRTNSIYIRSEETENKTDKMLLYIPLLQYGEACIYCEGTFFKDQATYCDSHFIQELAECITDYIFLNFSYNNQKRTVAVIKKNNEQIFNKYFSKQMTLLYNQCLEFAKTDANILILGESGVGKEVLARNIHEESNKSGEFIAVNLANISESLYESETHGYEKGAFTNAIKQHIGYFERADQGTLFLDEVGDIPLSIQVKLLRVIQEKQFCRVGSTKNIHSDFRLITATNRDLFAEVKKGHFREDLFYRLAVLPLTIPSLKERKEDILYLSEAFLKFYQQKYNKKVWLLSDDDKNILLNYSWPGNIRELKNIIERYVILNMPEKTINIEYFIQPALQDKNFNSLPFIEKDFFTNLPSAKELENKYLNYLFDYTKGQIVGEQGMAQILGLSKQQTYKKVKQADIRTKYSKIYIQKS